MNCSGCGTPIPPSRGGKPRKWCSDRCRKRQYARACVDCGAPTNGSNGRGPNAAVRCLVCNGLREGHRQHDAFAPYRRMIEQMWAEGMKGREIGEALGWSEYVKVSNIANLQKRGYNLPHRRTPEQIARMLVGSDERLAKARAARKART